MRKMRAKGRSQSRQILLAMRFIRYGLTMKVEGLIAIALVIERWPSSLLRSRKLEVLPFGFAQGRLAQNNSRREIGSRIRGTFLAGVSESGEDKCQNS